MRSGREEAFQDWTRNDDGRRKVYLKKLGEEGSPCWSPLEMDTGRCPDLGCDSVVRLKYDPCRERTEPDAGPCSLDQHIA